jgi:hypothetical protein
LGTPQGFRVQPDRDYLGDENRDDVAREEHSEAGGDARSMTPKRQRTAVAQGGPSFETRIG